MTRGVAGGSRLTRFASFVLHPLTGGVAGGAGLASHRSLILHLLPWRVILCAALSEAQCGRAEQQARGSRNR
jgi:hypothetical protein